MVTCYSKDIRYSGRDCERDRNSDASSNCAREGSLFITIQHLTLRKISGQGSPGVLLPSPMLMLQADVATVPRAQYVWRDQTSERVTSGGIDKKKQT